MRLLIIVPAYAPFVGGAQTLCRGLAQGFVADQHRVTVLTTNSQQADDFWLPPPANRAPLAYRETLEGVQIVRLPLFWPWPAPWRFGLLRRISHLLARFPLPGLIQKPLLRHFTPFMPPILELQSEVRRAAEKAELILLVDAGWDGLFANAAEVVFSLAKPVIALPLLHTGSPAILSHFCMAHQMAVYRQAAAVIALSVPERTRLTGWGVTEDRLHCLSPGVTPLESLPLGASEEENSPLPSPYVLFLGAATYDKGAFTLAQAVAELLRQGEEVALVFAGPQQHRLAVFIDTLPPELRAILKPRLHLLGQVDEATKQRLLAGCTVLALPSRVDSFGIVILEAWQHAKGVVAAAVGGPASLIAHEETGLLVPFGDSTALAGALARMLNEAGLVARLGAAGHQIVIHQFTWDKCYDAFYQIAARIIAPAGG